MTEIDLNEERQQDDHQERETYASSVMDNAMEDYYTYGEIRSLTSVPYADPQEESSVIKRPAPEPFGRPAIWALFLESLAVVFGILAGILTELSNENNNLLLLRERENAIFFAQMLGGTSIALSVVAIRLLARVAREHQFKRLSRGKPMYQKTAWISFTFGIIYSSALLVASFLYDNAPPGRVYTAVPINFLPFILMMVNSEAARKH
eukprot:CAMPEP_0113628594 /NCGR_PEP_ID=MMETSP0017_2-20120614/14817_1 /TAXON_ID=2856 /ORGANISM="Cylindrotheca closterium" /LENGTH=206 /DNA_ID=CAMNT_0000538907 /DNA_START=81 /DNA_END=701 /DNA_ORIENTATION=+ /assembly_acc=CAM_ASM_000147